MDFVIVWCDCLHQTGAEQEEKRTTTTRREMFSDADGNFHAYVRQTTKVLKVLSQLTI